LRRGSKFGTSSGDAVAGGIDRVVDRVSRSLGRTLKGVAGVVHSSAHALTQG